MEDWDDCMSYATKLAEWRELANNITAGSIPESAISTQFLKGLPARYEAVVTAIDVRGETDMDTILPLVRDFETKIGVTGGTQAQAPALHAGTSSAELCRQFARGQCRRGDRCRYRHASAPSQSNGRSHAGRREGRTCHYCGKVGHLIKDCRRKKREDALARTPGVLTTVLAKNGRLWPTLGQTRMMPGSTTPAPPGT